ncbi:allophanate hydrolase subunit 1 [Candidatus Pelagibacter sp.]|jgi:KipI family sensor histidine kinase inhibitor|nr:allophanate hydrolase subunit 1 [Candidatus Pelagibacter sp.]
MIKNILNLGDAALYCDFGQDVNKTINSNVIKYYNNIKKLNIESINNITPSYNKLIISFDLNKIKFNELKNIIEKIHIDDDEKLLGKQIEIPVCCEEPYSLDLSELERKLNLTKEIILNNFFKNEYFCYMTGFIAGMPFLGDINESLRAKRLETPRVKVPKGSVGITEQFTNIYTFESPGGWNIIGNTPLKVFDSSKEIEPNLINPGDTVLFKRISKEEYLNYE